MEKTDTALIVGLDIGTTKVCAVVGEVDTDGQVKIVGIGDSESKGLRKGMVVNIEDTVKSIQQAVTTAGQMAGCDIRSVYVGIAGSHIMGINSHGVIAIQGNEVTTHDVDRVLDAARAVAIPSDREVIHTLPQEYIVDNQRGIVDPIGMAGVRLEVNVHIVTAAVSSAQNIVRSCNRAGLDVADIALESLASAKAVLTDEEREIGVALVDIGGGTSEVAIISLGGIVTARSVRVAGDEFDSAIINYIKKKYNLLIGERTAENIKMGIGSAYKTGDTEPVMDIKGRNLLNGLPENITVTSEEIREAISEPLSHVIDAIKTTLEKTPPELAADIIESGIMLAGGGALLRGLDQLIHEETGMPVKIAERPLDCVADGTGKVLENIDKLEDVLSEDENIY